MAVKVVELPFTDGSGITWDNNTGPDVYYLLNDASDNVLVSGSTFSNVAASGLPLLWTVAPAFQITNFGTSYKLRIYDQDTDDLPPNPDDYIGGYVINLSAYAAAGYPSVITLSSPNSSLKIDLSVQWQ